MATNIKIGDFLNPAGATPLLNMDLLDPSNFNTGDNSQTPQNLRDTPLTQWSSGLGTGGQYATPPGETGALFFNEPGNGDDELYPTGLALKKGLVRSPYTGGKGSPLVITPFPINAAEVALYEASTPEQGVPTPQFISGSVNTFPYYVSPPCAFGGLLIYPPDMSDESGEWPACWALDARNTWPPEIDMQDGLNGLPGSVFFNAGAVFGANGNETGGSGNMMGSVQFVPGTEYEMITVVYPDITAWFCNGVCTGTCPTPANFATAQWFIIPAEMAIKVIEGWPEVEPIKNPSMSSLTLLQAYALAMPAVYPGPANQRMTIPTLGSTTPTPTPAPTPTPTPGPTPMASTIAQVQAAVAALGTLVSELPPPTTTSSGPTAAQLTALNTALASLVTAIETAQAQYAAAFKEATTNFTASGPMFTTAAATMAECVTDAATLQNLVNAL